MDIPRKRRYPFRPIPPTMVVRQAQLDAVLEQMRAMQDRINTSVAKAFRLARDKGF